MEKKLRLKVTRSDIYLSLLEVYRIPVDGKRKVSTYFAYYNEDDKSTTETNLIAIGG